MNDYYARIITENLKIYKGNSPGRVLGGALLMMRAEFPFINIILSLWNVWAVTSLSSLPVCLANCLPRVLITLIACGCQPPRVSTDGDKMYPLGSALPKGLPVFSVIGMRSCSTSSFSSLTNKGLLDGANHCYIQGCIMSLVPGK